MKRRDLLAHLDRCGCEFRREGGRHTVYYNPATGRTTTIPRHREVNENLVRKICRDLAIREPN
jgi:predicted RNA binding protein YcfA (HicA-like mRNA interferase family)